MRGLGFGQTQVEGVLHRDRADRGAVPAGGALGGIDIARLPVYRGLEISRLSRDFLDFAEGVDFDVGVPADLDQLGGDNSHGTIIGGKRLVDLGHGAADGRAFFHQMDVIA